MTFTGSLFSLPHVSQVNLGAHLVELLVTMATYFIQCATVASVARKPLWNALLILKLSSFIITNLSAS